MKTISFASFLKQNNVQPQKKVRALGIDLGTTNSTAAEAVFDPESLISVQVSCIPVEQTGPDGKSISPFVPSMVAIHKGSAVIGHGAKRMRSHLAENNLMWRKNLFFESKNDMGIRTTYHLAPQGFRYAWEIGGRVLNFLNDAACAADPAGFEKTVLTVPASFQSAQRNDTRKAASFADILLGGFIDEPVAAFLDYLFTHGLKGIDLTSGPKNLLVFDFGGGTCDVAVLRVAVSAADNALCVSPVAISRYHRLGGGDIDRAIVHELLIPLVCRQNGLRYADMGYEEKKRFFEPSLMGIAESLKIDLCDKIQKRREKNPVAKMLDRNLVSELSGTFECRVFDNVIRLKDPVLTEQQFETILQPFVDTALLYSKDTEYRHTCSIFSPITDALERCGFSQQKIDLCLLAGGSSLILRVQEAVAHYFSNAVTLVYPDAESIQTTVARGAAYHALALALTGKGVIETVAQDSISIITDNGPVEIVPEGAHLPYPADGEWGVITGFAMPAQAGPDAVKVRVELVAGNDGRPVSTGVWTIENTAANKGDPIRLSYKYDENQMFHLKMIIDDGIERPSYEAEIENPLTCIVNPNRTEIAILELEENLKTGVVSNNMRDKEYQRLADMYAEVGKREKAAYLYKYVLRTWNQPDSNILNKLGILYGEMGNRELQEKMYREAINTQASDISSPLYNLALVHKDRGELGKALAAVDEAIARAPYSAPYKVLKGIVLEKDSRQKESKRVLEEAATSFDPMSAQTDWELSLYRTCMQMLAKKDKAEEAEKEQIRRQEAKRKNQVEMEKTGLLPAYIA
ncbi:MAG: hypothetical protein A2268_10130 [Candidatus Raymondbacteria bacterium RifOxyA12_full_50_37]|uniref:Uncharacterized protein n=1 Tax=Candidatus Raymondbacteria bacterium RIFOXYD12_FULL_49_13 TaxID=1817890 RepID=A0A1F7F4B5_UNCRA|nr:MAG: hypothetical protein A2268_10130 [Candidatus Raymondbacteria bacterium RifOxyA12_full_50_37]OGJ93807.1 MAG: hypothetical protein A2248_06170 [Candidatus Raymondbacteria bacterium RIFOXYA2_FULL_49_16]OGJ98326.1 MAG: hypothetical protein A2453_01005 [Candidatus Raymondbacteria bacterium RIFOXYC2_FULL_50_21]OGK01377.1 MAG: hypothetical protein A2519_14755 [Candidatus Raymondbacteria bacterium RIFOXYD12_FULL_49_13]OGP45311.1 MAG: hypothetical protein A2324_21930 [Candidatus Raymondbacteria 